MLSCNSSFAISSSSNDEPSGFIVQYRNGKYSYLTASEAETPATEDETIVNDPTDRNNAITTAYTSNAEEPSALEKLQTTGIVNVPGNSSQYFPAEWDGVDRSGGGAAIGSIPIGSIPIGSIPIPLTTTSSTTPTETSPLSSSNVKCAYKLDALTNQVNDPCKRRLLARNKQGQLQQLRGSRKALTANAN